MIVHKGFKFTVHRQFGLKTRWRCTERHRGCRAFIYTIDEEIINLNYVEHNH